MLGSMSDQSNLPRPTVLLDCDPGHDDAIAILVAAQHTDLVGITTVAGNAPLANTTRNALIMRDLLGVHVPVHSGADRPLVVEADVAADVHGVSGLDGADLPASTTPLDGIDAARFIVDTCRTIDDVWLVPVGPLTNIATALRSAPDIVDRIAGISLMGGGSYGNRTAAAEFNIWADPDAAAIVYSCGAPIVMAGLDVTHQFQATPDRVDALRSIDGQLATVLADLLTFFSDSYRSLHDDGALLGAAIHDPLAVMAITHPDLFTRHDRHVSVEARGATTRGMTLIDERRVRSRLAPNCSVLTSVDADRAFDVVLGSVRHFSR